MNLILFFIFIFNTIFKRLDFIEIDLFKKEIGFNNLTVKEVKIDGLFNYVFEKEDIFLKGNLKIKTYNKQKNYPFKLKFSLEKKIILLKGEFDIGYLEGSLNIEEGIFFCKFGLTDYEEIYLFNGLGKGEIVCWGKLDNFFCKGKLELKELKEYPEVFLVQLSFWGKYPIFYLNEGRLILKNNNLYELSGYLNLNEKNLLKFLDVFPQKIYLGDWVLEKNEQANILKKSGEKDLEIYIDKSKSGVNNLEDRFNLKIEKDKFFMFKMEEERNIFGLEKRRKF